MAFAMDVVEVAATSGNQTINLRSGFGIPDAGLFIVTNATTLGSAQTHFMLSIGAASSNTERWNVWLSGESGQLTTDESCGSLLDEIITIVTPGTPSVIAQADIVSFGEDEIVINWSNAPESNFRMMIVAFQGDNFYAGNAAIPLVQDNSTDVTGPNFEPEFGFGLCVDALSGADNTSNNRWGVGLFHSDNGSVSQNAALIRSNNGGLSQNIDGQLISDGFAGSTDSSGDVLYRVEIDNIDAQGFSAFAREGVPPSATDLFYLVGAGAIEYALQTPQTRTANGNQSVVTSFMPQGILGIATKFTALDTARGNSAEAGSIGFFAADTVSEVCFSGQKEEGVGTTDTQSYVNTKVLDLPSDDGSTPYTAIDFVATATGWDWDYTATDGVANYLITLAFQEEDSNGDNITDDHLWYIPIWKHRGLV